MAGFSLMEIKEKFAMHLDVAYFQARLHAVFQCGELALTLAEVEPSGNPQAFSLLFDGPAQPVLDQQTLVLERAGDTPLAIFLVPVGRSATAVRYQAIFNN